MHRALRRLRGDHTLIDESGDGAGGEGGAEGGVVVVVVVVHGESLDGDRGVGGAVDALLEEVEDVRVGGLVDDEELVGARHLHEEEGEELPARLHALVDSSYAVPRT